MKLYHVTLKTSLASILQNGLEPRLGARSVDCGETVAAVFVFTDRMTCEEALINWLGDAFDEAEDLVILELDYNSETFQDVEYETMIREPIPASAIVAVYDEDFGPLPI